MTIKRARLRRSETPGLTLPGPNLITAALQTEPPELKEMLVKYDPARRRATAALGYT